MSGARCVARPLRERVDAQSARCACRARGPKQITPRALKWVGAIPEIGTSLVNFDKQSVDVSVAAPNVGLVQRRSIKGHICWYPFRDGAVITRTASVPISSYIG